MNYEYDCLNFHCLEFNNFSCHEYLKFHEYLKTWYFQFGADSFVTVFIKAKLSRLLKPLRFSLFLSSCNVDF